VAKLDLSLSLSHEYHHRVSLELTNRIDGSTTLLREHRGGLLPCGSNAVCVFFSSS
jgi:hypothetical protein